jgi:hypothetical protein
MNNKFHIEAIKNERKKMYPAIKDLHNFLIKNKINFFGVTQLDSHNKENGFNKPFVVISDKDNKFFLDFFKGLYKKYYKKRNQVFFSLPVKKRYHYIYMLNLQPVLIIYHMEKVDNFINRINLHSLKHLYYEYTLPVNFSNYWSDWMKVEDKILNLFLKNKSNKPDMINNQFLYLNLKIKDLFLTGGRAYDMIMGASYFANSHYDIITSDTTVLVNQLKSTYDMEFDEIKVNYDNKIPYFYTHIQLYFEGQLIFNIFEYSRLVNYIEIDGVRVSNYHGVCFHLLHESLNNDYYVKELLNVVKKNGIVGNFDVFQKKYSLEFAKTMLKKRNQKWQKKLLTIDNDMRPV